MAQRDLLKQKKKLSKEELASELERASEIVKGVFSELPSYDEIVPKLLEHGIDDLKDHCKLTPGNIFFHPTRPTFSYAPCCRSSTETYACEADEGDFGSA